MKKKIVIDARMINDSGIGTYLKNLIPFFIKDFNVTLLGDKKKLSIFKNLGNYHIINFNAKIYSFKEQLLFPFIIPKCDIFWAPHFNSPFFKIKTKKRVTTIHDVNHLAFDSGMSILKKMYAKRLYLNSLSLSDSIITVSEFSKTEIIKYLNLKANRIKVIYGGVNQVFFKTNKSNHNLDLPKNYILFVGNVKPHKNLITLLKAYSKLSKDFRKKYKLLVLGKKEGFITPDKIVFNFIEKKSLKKDVFFTGFIDDVFVPEIYAKASLFVFPSLYEGFGLPLLEAMASKTIVISSNRASLPEVGLDNVLYFNPKNSEELKEKIIKTIDNKDLKEFYSNKAYHYAKSFSWEKSAKEHLRLFKKLV